MFPLRLVECELDGFGILAPSRQFTFNPGFNLMVGDPGSGKTTLIAALLGGFHGLTPLQWGTYATGSGAMRIRLQVQATEELLELRGDWTNPAVEVVALPDERPVFRSDSWSGLLDVLEQHTGLTGLAATCLLSAQSLDLSVPPGLETAAQAPPAQTGPAVEEERARLAAHRQELAAQLDVVSGQQQQLDTLKRWLEPQLARFKAAPDGFLDLLSNLIRSRQDLVRLTAVEAAHAESVRASREELNQARGRLATAYPGLSTADSEYPILFQRYKTLEREYHTRQSHLEGLRTRLSQVTTQVLASTFPIEPWPDDFESLVMTLLAAVGDEPLEAIPPGLEDELQEVQDVLASYSFDSDGPDFGERLTVLEEARRDAAELKERVQAIGTEVYTMAQEGVLHQRAARWPSDFPDRLGRLRDEQNQRQRRVVAIDEQLASLLPLTAEIAALQAALAACEGIEAEGPDFPLRLEALARARQARVDIEAAVAERRGRLAEIDATLEQDYAWLAAIGEAYPPQLEAVCKLSIRLSVEQQTTAATLDVVAGLTTARAALASRLETELADLQSLPSDLPDRAVAYARLQRLQQDLEARHSALMRRRDELVAQRAEYAEFAAMDDTTVSRLAQWRGRDAVLHRLVQRLDTELEERRRAEAELRDVEERLSWLPTLPDGFPALRAIMADHQAWLDDLDRQMEAIEDDPTSSPELRARLEQFYARWCERQARISESERAAAELTAARARLESLREQLRTQGLPLNVDQVTAWHVQQETLQGLLNTLNLETEGSARARKSRKSTWLGETEDPKDRLAEIERERAEQVAAWNLASAEDVPGLLEMDRAAGEKLAAARSLVECLEVLAQERPDEPPVEGAEGLGVSTGEDALRQLAAMRQVDEARVRRPLLQAHRAAVAALVEQWHARMPEIPAVAAHLSVEAAWDRQTRLQESRIALQASLGTLRPQAELEADRRKLLKWVSKGLGDGGGKRTDQTIRRLLEYQKLTHELEDVQAAADNLGSGSRVGRLLERLAEDRSRIEQALGPDLLADLPHTLERLQQWQKLRQEAQALDARLAELPAAETLQDALQALATDLQESLARLHLKGIDGVAEALERYRTWRDLEAEKKLIQGAIEAELAHHEEQVRSLEKAVGPWTGPDLQQRWEEARRTVEALEEATSRLAAAPSPEALERERLALEEATTAGCRQLGVPREAGEDMALLAEWCQMVTWQEGLAAMSDELARELTVDDAGQTRLDRLGRQVRELEASLGVTEEDDLTEVRADYQAALPERVRAESLWARYVLAVEQDTRMTDELAEAGLPVMHDDATASVEQFVGYGRLLQDLRATEIELEAAGRPDPSVVPLSDIEREMEELRPRLAGREQQPDAEAELQAFLAYQADVALCDDLDMSVAALEADSQAQHDRQRAAELVVKTEQRLGDWIKADDAETVRTEYQAYLAARQESATLRDALARQPTPQYLQSLLETTERTLAELPTATEEPPPASDSATETAPLLDRCRQRASDILFRVSAGRYHLDFSGDGARVLTDEGETVPATPQQRRQIGLWWRLALCLELQDLHPWPLLLDDPFAGLSSGDQMELSEFLLELAAERQVIVLTANRSLALDVNHDLG